VATTFQAAVLAVLDALPAGEVITYGEVAAEAGRPGAARAVGRVMATSDTRVPWWRVVAADGRLAPGKEDDQRRRLRAEGVDVGERRVRGMHRR
jgi:methylated-DNA-protein-cysteine methyltransferase-like protein